jgi:hypothetical protein
MIYVVPSACALMAIAFSLLLRPKAKQRESSKSDALDSKALMLFLEKADDAYILTHEAVDISFFSKFASTRVCNQIIDDIHKKPPKLFGTKNYRHRRWSVISQEKDKITVQKEITHKHIEVKRGIRVALGDDMIESWCITLNPNGFCIEEVS